MSSTIRGVSNDSMSAHRRHRRRRVVVPQQRGSNGSIVTRQRPQRGSAVTPKQAAVMAVRTLAWGQTTGCCNLRNKEFCSIRSSAKAEADKVADIEAHEKEAGGAWAETILPVPGAEHLVETGSGGLPVSAQYLLLSIWGCPGPERRVTGHDSGALWFMCALVHGRGGRHSAPGPGNYNNI